MDRRCCWSTTCGSATPSARASSAAWTATCCPLCRWGGKPNTSTVFLASAATQSSCHPEQLAARSHHAPSTVHGWRCRPECRTLETPGHQRQRPNLTMQCYLLQAAYRGQPIDVKPAVKDSILWCLAVEQVSANMCYVLSPQAACRGKLAGVQLCRSGSVALLSAVRPSAANCITCGAIAGSLQGRARRGAAAVVGQRGADSRHGRKGLPRQLRQGRRHQRP